MDKFFQKLTAFLFAMGGFMWGKADGLLYALIAFMALDYISGVISAYIRKEISSAVGFIGIVKKVFIMFLVAVAHILDTQVIGDGSVCRSAVIGFYISNEGISILENAVKIGLPLPKKLVDILAEMKNNDENK
ncbi:MAG: phage holin family protein [Ruminococcus sp.]|nr:phage holin family protein [Ruminococcus sp.]